MDGSICRINDEVKIAFSKPVYLTNCTSTYFVFNFVDEIVYHVVPVYANKKPHKQSGSTATHFCRRCTKLLKIFPLEF